MEKKKSQISSIDCEKKKINNQICQITEVKVTKFVLGKIIVKFTKWCRKNHKICQKLLGGGGGEEKSSNSSNGS